MIDPKIIGQVVGANVRRLRLEAGLSQEEFCAQVGMSRSYLSNLENGQRNPTVELLAYMAQVLGVGLMEFFRT